MAIQGLSIIICCHNSSKIIEETLECFKNQETSEVPFEIILVDNNSTDNTGEKAINYWGNCEIAKLIIVKELNAGLMHARKTGIKTANFEVLSFIDDDNHVPRNWVNFVNKAFQNKNVGLLGVKTILKANFPVPDWFLQHQINYAVADLYNISFGDVTKKGLIFGAGMSIRKQVFIDLEYRNWKALLTGRQGKNNNSGDDSEICLAARLIGNKIYYSNEIVLEHCIAQNRIKPEKLLDLAYSFGEADVKFVPYLYFWNESQNQLSTLDYLKHYWWFWYLGKILVHAKTFVKYKIGALSKLDFQVLSARNMGFRNSILKDKKQLRDYFETIKLLAK